MEGFVTVNIELEEMLVHVSPQHLLRQLNLSRPKQQTKVCSETYLANGFSWIKKKELKITMNGVPYAI